ncbi:hypothetical protein ABC304_07690 [Microbacterium sp. 1P10UB]|uniref:hypothetical protein n=1 Tax=unclassified Microbacterium TaxID=2609290 RepID=UPI00399F679E
MNGANTTVCTTYKAHGQALQASGGTLATVGYGCSIGDVVCVTFENAGRGLAISATAMMFVVSDNASFDTGSVLWTAATTEWSFWQWAILVVLFGAMVWAIAAAIVSGDRSELVGALVRSFIAVPAVPLTLWVTGNLLNSVDKLTWYVLTRDDAIGMFVTLQGVMWAGGQANYFFAFLIHGLLMIALVLLMVVFAFRNIALAALIAVGPIAWMMFPVRSVGPQWVVRYVSAVVVLLLTGPLTVGFMTLIINGLASVKTIWNPQSWPLLIGLALIAFAPFAIFGLFSFVGAAAADGLGSRLGSGGARAAQAAGRSALRVPSRLGGTPSGMPTSRSGSSRAPAGQRGSGSRATGPSTASHARPGQRPPTPATPAAGRTSTRSSAGTATNTATPPAATSATTSAPPPSSSNRPVAAERTSS